MLIILGVFSCVQWGKSSEGIAASAFVTLAGDRKKDTCPFWLLFRLFKPKKANFSENENDWRKRLLLCLVQLSHQRFT